MTMTLWILGITWLIVVVALIAVSWRTLIRHHLERNR